MPIWLYVAMYIFCQTVKACLLILVYMHTTIVTHIWFATPMSIIMLLVTNDVTTHTSYQLVPVSANMSGLS